MANRFVCSIAILGLVAISPAIAGDKVTPAEIDRIITTIPMHPDWREIKVSPNDPRSLTLNFRETPSVGQAQGDAEAVATTIIQALVARGHDPAKEHLSIYVNALQNGFTTVTGKPGTRLFGMAYYNYNDDAIVWKPFK